MLNGRIEDRTKKNGEIVSSIGKFIVFIDGDIPVTSTLYSL